MALFKGWNGLMALSALVFLVVAGAAIAATHQVWGPGQGLMLGCAAICLIASWVDSRS